MQVINSLIEDSFAYTGEKENIGMRRDEIGVAALLSVYYLR